MEDDSTSIGISHDESTISRLSFIQKFVCDGRASIVDFFRVGGIPVQYNCCQVVATDRCTVADMVLVEKSRRSKKLGIVVKAPSPSWDRCRGDHVR